MRFVASSSEMLVFTLEARFPDLTFLMRRSRLFILRNGQRLISYFLHRRLSTVRPIPSCLQAWSLGMWKQADS